MTLYLRSVSAGVGAALLLVPALSPTPVRAAPADADSARNLTQEAQQRTAIALPSLAPLADHVLPAVVNISVELAQRASDRSEGDGGDSGDQNGPFPGMPGGTPFDQFLRRFFENQQPQINRHIVALGSGFIIDPRGDIVTNNHVVANAEKVTVIFQNGQHETAKVVGRDERTDLALLRVKAGQQLPYVEWGNSDRVKVGDWVVAVGNPFGLGGTVTAGIVSALGRNINEGPYDDFLQIDAPINRGNSGGPTFDLEGRVIGINTAIYSPSGGSVGIGFAIPSNVAKHVIDQLEQHGKVSWGWIGVEIQSITPAIARSLGLDPSHPEGALVASVALGGPAAKAGLESGDVITAAGDHPIKDVHDLPRLVAETPIGSTLDLAVHRGGKTQTIAVAVGEMPSKVAEAGGEASRASALGMELAPLTPQLRRQLRIGKEVRGVVVMRMAAGSPAAALGIEPGDVIESIDRKPTTSPQEAAAQLKEAAQHDNILLLLDRHGVTQFVALSVGNGAPGG